MMMRAALRRVGLAAIGCVAVVSGVAPANATYLFWNPPSFKAPPVRGDEPGLIQPLPGATEKEVRANLLWHMRAGLNVAALQCQFAPMLQTVENYNRILAQHGKELADAYTSVSGYFKRTAKTGWQTKLDQYTTRTYQGFSTMHAQRGFCDTAGAIGDEALSRAKGKLYQTAEARMGEFRKSLVPAEDGLFTRIAFVPAQPVPPLDPKCWDKKDLFRNRCADRFPVAAAVPLQAQRAPVRPLAEAQLEVDPAALN